MKKQQERKKARKVSVDAFLKLNLFDVFFCYMKIPVPVHVVVRNTSDPHFCIPYYGP